MSVLVSGGAGYIGTHTCVELLNANKEIIVADNLVNSSEIAIKRVEEICKKTVPFVNVDLCDLQKTRELFINNPNIDSVIHFAALKAVGESVQKPLEYYDNNITSLINIVKCMREFGVKNIVFSSSATVYGDPETVPITENSPLSATNPYGRTKLYIEQILKDIAAVEPTMNIALLRYFNPIGAHESGLIGEDPSGIPNNLVPYIAKVAVGELKEVHVFGDDYNTPDGTGVRDYIHVVDLAKGHVAALKKLDENCNLFICNLGTGNGYSVLEIINAYSEACGKKLAYVIDPRRPGDIAECYADTKKAKDELNWSAQYGIAEMCQSSWNWQSKNPKGYN